MNHDASVAGVVRRLLAVARGRLLGGGLVALAGVLGRVLKYIAKVKKMFGVSLRAVNDPSRSFSARRRPLKATTVPIYHLCTYCA